MSRPNFHRGTCTSEHRSEQRGGTQNPRESETQPRIFQRLGRTPHNRKIKSTKPRGYLIEHPRFHRDALPLHRKEDPDQKTPQT